MLFALMSPSIACSFTVALLVPLLISGNYSCSVPAMALSSLDDLRRALWLAAAAVDVMMPHNICSLRAVGEAGVTVEQCQRRDPPLCGKFDAGNEQLSEHMV